MREEDTVCVGSDGLQYCKVCGEAKEAFFPEGGFMTLKTIPNAYSEFRSTPRSSIIKSW